MRRLDRRELKKAMQGMAAMNTHIAYQDEAASSEAGREADALRQQGQKLAKKGHDDDAHAFFREAAELFEADDLSAAAGAAFYDLAESLKRVSRGVERDSLHEAVRLLELSLKSPARQADVLRKALTLDSLGQSRRRLAGLAESESEKDDLLDRAIDHLREACRLVERLEPMGPGRGSNYRTNLANAQMDRGLLDDAIQNYGRAIDLVMRHFRLKEELQELGPSKEELPRIQLNLVGALLLRAQPKDLNRALALCKKVLNQPLENHRDRARTLGAKVLLARAQRDDKEEAVRWLKSVNFQLLKPTDQLLQAELLVQVGDADTALVVLEHAQKKASRLRRDAMADHEADTAAAEMQKSGAMKARIHAKRGAALEAFLALENTSALRYHDGVTGFHHSPADPVTRELVAGFSAWAYVARELADLAARLAYIPQSDHGEVLAEFADQILNALDLSKAGPLVKAAIERAHEWLQKARHSASATATLRRAAWECVGPIQHLRSSAAAREPESDPSAHAWSYDLAAPHLLELLEQQPDTVLLRVHWQHDLLAVAVWLDDGALKAKCLLLDPPDGFFRVLTGPESDTDGSSALLVDHDAERELTEALAKINLSPLLPASCPPKLIVLPSLLASLVPWPAIGPEGRDLLSRFESIAVLPSLTPLRMRQAPNRLRSGTLLAAPADASEEAATLFHGVAFEQELPEEKRLFGQAATVKAVCEAAGSVDIVALYAHGTYGTGEPGSLRMADGALTPVTLGQHVEGAERVELWACRSGVNLPEDWLTPLVDEAFGIDIDLHHRGVRSTIGTLWSVPDLVTGQIVRHYRQGLASGLDAPTALVRAQRWWRDHAVVSLDRNLRALPLVDALEQISLDLDVEPAELKSVALLGPVESDETLLSDDEADAVMAHLGSPKAWAGYRFVGVSERRPQGALDPDSVRPLTEEERAELLAIAEEEPPETRDADDLFAELLQAARVLKGNVGPSPEQAIKVARLYADRRVSCRRHNLLRGLAWLHECLADSTLDGLTANSLHDEAACMWLELARGELLNEQLRVVRPADEALLSRAEGCAGDTPTGQLVRAWVAALRSAVDGLDGLRQGVEAHWPQALEDAARAAEDNYARIRAAGLCGDLLLLHPAPSTENVSLALQRLPAPGAQDFEHVFVAAHLNAVRCRLAAQIDRFEPEPHAAFLPHREIARQLNLLGKQVGPEKTAERLMQHEAMSEDIGYLEADIWGYPSDDGAPFWINSGTPGGAWHQTVGAYVAAQLRDRPADAVVPHFIASIQMGADLRLGPQNGLARLSGFAGQGENAGLWWLSWAQGEHLQQLEDIARVARPPNGSKLPAAPDGFSVDAHSARVGVQDNPLVLTGWLASECLAHWWQDLGPSRTLAFAVERALLETEAGLSGTWKDINEGLSKVAEAMKGAGKQIEQVLQMVQPRRDLEDAESWVRSLGEGTVCLGAFLGGAGELLLAACWREGDRLECRSHVSDPGVGIALATRLSLLLRPRPEDVDQPGIGLDRAEIWQEIAQTLATPLESVLGDAINADKPRGLLVVAPGPLRSLPWAGLRVGDRPIWHCLSGVSSLPHIGFEKSAFLLTNEGDTPFTMCVQGDDSWRDHLRYGSAAIATLRRLRVPEVAAEPARRPSDGKIVEVDALEACADRVQVLRLYGECNWVGQNPTTEALELTHGRALSTRNLANSLLPRCGRVELWAATGSTSEARAIMDGDRDPMPRLVRAFLAAGAVGVVDIAWPVPDLVKALVFECFGLLRKWRPSPGPTALSIAIAMAGSMLESLHRDMANFANAGQALQSLDEARRRQAGDMGFSPDIVVPHRRSEDDKLSAEELIASSCQLHHLAAFRWWGV